MTEAKERLFHMKLKQLKSRRGSEFKGFLLLHVISPSTVLFTQKLSTGTASLKPTLETGSDWIATEQ